MPELLPRPEPNPPSKPTLEVVIRQGRPLWCWRYCGIEVCHGSGSQAWRQLEVACLEAGITVPQRPQ